MATETNEPFQKVATNHKRDHHHRRHLTNTNECQRQELYVEFESIGWSEWIIAPKGMPSQKVFVENAIIISRTKANHNSLPVRLQRLSLHWNLFVPTW